MKIHVNGRNIQCGITKDGDKLGLVLLGETSVAEIYNAFLPATMPEITILDDAGSVISVYANHRILGAHWGQDRVQIDLQVEPLEATEAEEIRARIDAQEANTAGDEDAIAELAAIIADLEERVETLEGGNE